VLLNPPDLLKDLAWQDRVLHDGPARHRERGLQISNGGIEGSCLVWQDLPAGAAEVGVVELVAEQVKLFAVAVAEGTR
jgi:hypothetical protein